MGKSETIELLAAASTTEAVTALVGDIQQRLNIRVRPTFAASSTLAKHIAAGAPAHLYLSANTAWTTYLQELNLIAPDGRIDLLGNRLVLLGRSTNSTSNFELADLSQALGGERLIMADPDHVPAGRYGRQALKSLDLWKAVKGRAVFGASVRNTLALLAGSMEAFNNRRSSQNPAMTPSFIPWPLLQSIPTTPPARFFVLCKAMTPEISSKILALPLRPHPVRNVGC